MFCILSSIIDELCPTYVGEKRIVLTLAENSTSPRAFNPISVDIDYAECAPQGIVFPLELTILAPSEQNFVRKIYNRIAPSQISFLPKEGGRYVVKLGEVGHNRWFGVLSIEVAGESATTNRVT